MIKKTTTRSRNNKKLLIISVLIAVFAMAGMGFGITYARYYAIQYRQGISVASGLYFSSNMLSKIPGQTTDIGAINDGTLQTIVNSSRWAGGTTSFDISIRNYDSNLLYNDSNLNIEYEIWFMLLDTPQGASYSVTPPQGQAYTVDLPDGSTNTVTTPNGESVALTSTLKFTKRTLVGGTLSSDTFKLNLKMDDSNNYNKAKVMVVAYPTAPDYVVNEQNQEQRLVGVFQGVFTDVELKVDKAEFLVQGESDYNSSTWKNKVKDLSGLIYNVKTIGDVVPSDTSSNQTKPQAIIKWNTQYLTLSKYDAYYEYALKKNDEIASGPDLTLPKWYWEDPSNNAAYLRVEVMPYSSLEVTFYKTPLFMTEFNNDSMTQDNFEALVKAYTEDNGTNNNAE